VMYTVYRIYHTAIVVCSEATQIGHMMSGDNYCQFIECSLLKYHSYATEAC